MKLLAYRKLAIRVPRMWAKLQTRSLHEIEAWLPVYPFASVYFRAMQLRLKLQPRFSATCIHWALADVYTITDRGICDASVCHTRMHQRMRLNSVLLPCDDNDNDDRCERIERDLTIVRIIITELWPLMEPQWKRRKVSEIDLSRCPA